MFKNISNKQIQLDHDYTFTTEANLGPIKK